MLEVTNLSPFAHIVFRSAETSERMANVVVAKAQYAMRPIAGASSDLSFELVHSEGAEEILVSEEAFGALNKSSMRTESDLAPYKPRCDVIVIGSAHSPTGLPMKQMTVGIDIEAAGKKVLSHRLLVQGARDFIRRDGIDHAAAMLVWAASLGLVKAPQWHLTEAEPFTQLPLRYEEAFGGELKVYAEEDAANRLKEGDKLPDEVRQRHPEGEAAPVAHRTCRVNPVGRGFAEAWHLRATRAARYPAPRIEAPASPLTPGVFDALISGKAKSGSEPALSPQGFGIIAKPWQPRLKLAGTYDETWKTEHWPYPPPDFDMAYWNGANPAMQCEYLRGGELVTLLNLLPANHPGTYRLADAAAARFRLPSLDVVLELVHRTQTRAHLKMAIDTLTIDLEAMAVSLVWRARIPESVELQGAVLAALDLAALDLAALDLTALNLAKLRSEPPPARAEMTES